jgi:hypothetical protein
MPDERVQPAPITLQRHVLIYDLNESEELGAVGSPILAFQPDGNIRQGPAKPIVDRRREALAASSTINRPVRGACSDESAVAARDDPLPADNAICRALEGTTSA